MNRLKTFSFWIVLMVVGVALYYLFRPPTETVMMYKSAPGNFGALIQVPSLYSEIKSWASIVGQCLGGIGGLGVVVKAGSELVKIFIPSKTRKVI